MPGQPQPARTQAPARSVIVGSGQEPNCGLKPPMISHLSADDLGSPTPITISAGLRSSWNTTSSTRCRRFSACQWQRTARANRQASRAREGCRSRLVAPPRSTSASTMAMARTPGKLGAAGVAAGGVEPSHVVADPVAADLDPAVVAVGNLKAAVHRAGRGVEQAPQGNRPAAKLTMSHANIRCLGA